MPKLPKRPRSSAELRSLYIRKEGTPDALTSAMATDRRDRRRQVASRVQWIRRTVAGVEPLLADALFRWLLGSCRSEDSMDTYSVAIRMWLERSQRRSLGAQVDVGPGMLSDHLFRLEADGLSVRTVVLHRAVLRSWYRWLFERDLVHRSPMTRDLLRAFQVDHGAVAKADGTRQALTREEACKVAWWALHLAEPEAGLAVMLQVTGGLRSEEVARLERRHLTTTESGVTLSVPGKGNKLRQIQLEPAAVLAWERYVRERRRQGTRGPLLVAPGGGHFHRRTIQRWAKAAAAHVGRELVISSHDLRKTALTLLVENGARLEEAQKIAGHASPQTTLRSYVVRQRPMTIKTNVEPKA